MYKLQQKHSEASAIVLGDLNHYNLDSTLPGFCQYIKTKDKDKKEKGKILDKCHLNVKMAYESTIWSPVENSDHNVVYSIPVYKTKLNSIKSKEREIRIWSPESKEELKAYLDWTDWEIVP